MAGGIPQISTKNRRWAVALKWSLHRHARKRSDCFLENQLVSPGARKAKPGNTDTAPPPPHPQSLQPNVKGSSPRERSQKPSAKARGGQVPFLLDSGCSICIQPLSYLITLLTRIPHCLSSQEWSIVCKTLRNTCLFRTCLLGSFILLFLSLE